MAPCILQRKAPPADWLLIRFEGFAHVTPTERAALHQAGLSDELCLGTVIVRTVTGAA